MDKVIIKCSNCDAEVDYEDTYYSEISKQDICRSCFQDETEWCPLCEEDFYSQELGKYHCYFGDVNDPELTNIKSAGIYKATQFPIFSSNGFLIHFYENSLELIRPGNIGGIFKCGEICQECIEKYK